VSHKLTIALVLAFGSACGGGRHSDAAPADSRPAAQAAASPQEAGTAALTKTTVTLYVPSASDDRLVAERREIIETPRPADRGAQILSALLDGPESAAALPLAPDGTMLHRLWVRDDGTAYADFSEQLTQGLAGSSEEILTLYAIVDSLAMNVPEIKTVAVLINGRERETLGGHIDVRRPLPPDPTLVANAPSKE
jgi:spore germination protein GerM